ncbi:MAG: hypothetical protein JNM39_12545 [Bdellovibrionaceae bacterium]|nr:hypothetical protein [Pseudobdellovibrionaceae bacterium]
MKRGLGLSSAFRFVLALTLITALFGVDTAQAKHGIFPTRFRIFPEGPLLSHPLMSAENLAYYGGPVLGRVHVISIFWGSTVNDQVQKNIGGFYAAIVNSTHMDFLAQYSTHIRAVDGREGTNQQIGRGSYGGEFFITPKNTKKTLDDSEIQAELEYQITQNVLPKPDSNTLFMIHFSPGIKITIEGMESCQAFCAYHNGVKSNTFGDLFYGVMPDYSSGACSFGCGMGSSVFDTTTYVSSHELVEAVTDPFPTPGDKPAYPQAWNTSNGSEIADVCPSSASIKTSTRTYKISQEWDNSTKSCKGGTFTSP